MNKTYAYPDHVINGRFVINERCSCGALKTEHNARFSPGHGDCERTKCRQFRWASWVYLSTKKKRKS